MSLGLAVEDRGHGRGHRVNLGQPVDGEELARVVVIPDQRRGLLVIFHQPGLEAVLVVVGAPLHVVAAADVAHPRNLRRLGLVVIDLAAIAAGVAAGDAGDERGVIDAHLDHRIEGLAVLRQQLAECIGLRQRAREAVEDEARGLHRVQLLLDQADDDLVGHQLAAVHHLGDAAAHLGPRGLGLAQHVAGRQLHHAALLHQLARLRALACAGRPQQDDVGHVTSPGRSAACGRLPARLFLAAQLRTFDQPLVLVREQVRLDLIDRVHRHRDHDQHRGAAEVERDRQLRAQDLGQQTDGGEIGRADHQHARHDVIEIFLGLLAGPDARDEAALVLQVVGNLVRLERHVRGVEIGEEDDHRGEEREIERLAGAEIGENRRHDRAGLAAREGRDRGRQQEQRRGEDRRDHARRVHLDRQMRRAAVIDLHADLAAGILDMDLAQRALHEHHEGNHRDHHHDHAEDHRGRDGAGAALLEEAGERMRDVRDDADEDDQRDAVADPARGDLLAQPHQEHRAADEGDDHRDEEEDARGMGEIALLEADRQAPGLEGGKTHRGVAGDLVDLLAALLAFLLHLLERRHQRGQQLHDDRGRDIGHDAEREDAHAAKRAAGEHRQHAADARARLVHELAQCVRINAGHRDVGAKPVDNEEADGEVDALPQLGGLAEGLPAEVRRHLLCSRSHMQSLSCERRRATVSRSAAPGKLLPYVSGPEPADNRLFSGGRGNGQLATGLLDGFDRRLRGAGHGQRDLRGDLALGQNTDAVELAAHEARSDQHVFGDLDRGVDLAFRDELLDQAEVDDGEVEAVRLGEAALRQTPVERHLAAFIAAERDARTRLLALDTTASGLALARARAARNAFGFLGGARVVAEFVEFHVASPLPETPSQATEEGTRRFLLSLGPKRGPPGAYSGLAPCGSSAAHSRPDESPAVGDEPVDRGQQRQLFFLGPQPLGRQRHLGGGDLEAVFLVVFHRLEALGLIAQVLDRLAEAIPVGARILGDELEGHAATLGQRFHRGDLAEGPQRLRLLLCHVHRRLLRRAGILQ
ncbi:hypothetical protein SDC9_41996 [bioreactor metagenome]|uniref:Uncharacterized protein n=1 Tax=bioreactor metagenome TaxID=1076179 RepID=A0A644VWH6_9ZZZZ